MLYYDDGNRPPEPLIRNRTAAGKQLNEVLSMGATAAEAAGTTPEAVGYSILQKWVAGCFFLAIVFIPVDVFPWWGTDSYTLRHFSFYPVALGAIAALPRLFREWIRCREILWLAALFAVMFSWSVLSSFWNCGVTPDVIRILAKRLISLGIWWGFGLFFAGAFFILPFESARRILLAGLGTVIALCAVCSVVEIARFCGVAQADAILIATGRLFRKSTIVWDWWPPELWPDRRVRGLFAEPLFLAIFTVPALVFLWGNFLEGRQRRISFLLSCLAAFLTIVTFSRTGWLLMLIALGGQYLMLERTGVFRSLPGRPRLSYLPAALLVMLMCAGFLFFIRSLKPDRLPEKAGTTYIQNADLTGGSLGVRRACLAMEFDLLREQPLLGSGVDTHGRRLLAVFQEQANAIPGTAGLRQHREIRQWEADGSFPMLNLYTGTAVESGLPGMLLLLLLCAFPLLFFPFRHSATAFQIAAAAALGSLLAAGMTQTIYVHPTFQLCWGVALAAVLRGAPHEPDRPVQ